MKLSHNKLLVAAALVTIVTLVLLLASSAGHERAKSSSFWPEFVNLEDVEQTTSNKEFFIEKLVQQQESGNDMRSALYLTHHKYLLNKIANLEISFHQKTYSLNDVCFKPHIAIFRRPFSTKFDSLPHYVQRLFLEMERLSPCLIVTPLNCFYDSYRIHQKISKWNTNTDFLNRRLRNSYIDSIRENETRPYVKSNYGPELIKGWAHHMFELSSRDLPNSTLDTLKNKVKQWLMSIEPRQKICANPKRSCDETLDDDNYLDICTAMQKNKDHEKKRLKLKFGFEDSNDEFITQLDCVDDREKFVEWFHQRELRMIMNTFPLSIGMPDHGEIVNQRCDGIYHDLNSSGIELFDGELSFINETSSFDLMRAEIAFLTPEMITSAMRHSDFVNGFESIWTIERAKELLHEFHVALREEVHKFNGNQASKQMGVTTSVDDMEKYETTPINMESVVHFLLIARVVLVISFLVLMWSVNPVRSTFMFLARDFLTIVTFAFLGKTDGVITLDSNLICYYVLLTFANLFLTTRVSFCSHRLARCIQRSKKFETSSNFSSLDTVDTLRETDSRQIHYALAKLTKFQAAQDTYSNEKFQKLSRNSLWIALLIILSIGCYWYFVDSTFQEICIILLPSIVTAAIEEIVVKRQFCKERREMLKNNKLAKEKLENYLTRSTVDNLFSGNEPRSEKKRIHTMSKLTDPNCHQNLNGRLLELSQSTYDVSRVMSYPNHVGRNIRLHIVSIHFRLMKMKRLGLFIFITAALLNLISVGLLFVPVTRESVHVELKHDDVFIEFELHNFSSNWESIMKSLRHFGEEMESIETLRTIVNWQNGLERFEQRFNEFYGKKDDLPAKKARKNYSSDSDSVMYFKWINDEPISSAVTGAFVKPTRSPVRFQFRYEIDGKNGTSIVETVQKIDIIISNFSKDLCPRATGVLYEHYHQNAVLWNNFALRQLLAASVLFSILSLIVVLFAVTPTVLSTILFSFFVVGNQLEIAAVISLFCLEHLQLYTNFAIFIGFLSAWTPFCELSRYRRRALYRAETRKTPELATRRRIRMPFVAVTDIGQFFCILLAVFSLLAAVSYIFPQFNQFFLPTVILISIQLCALVNSIAISIGVKGMFENDVCRLLHNDLRGPSTAALVYNLAHKPLTPPYEQAPIELDEMPITKSASETKIFAPPPRYPQNKKPRSSEETKQYDNEEGNALTQKSDSNVPGTSNIIQPLFSVEPEENHCREGCHPFNLSVDAPHVDDPYHRLIAGEPLDSRARITWLQPSNTLDDRMEVLEEYYELDEDEEEDVDSTGEPDEECMGKAEEAFSKWLAKKEAEKRKNTDIVECTELSKEAIEFPSPSVPGPSHQGENSEPSILKVEIDNTSGCSTVPSENLRQNSMPPVGHFSIMEQPTTPPVRPRMIQRRRPRNPLTDPPTMEEYIQDNDIPGLPPHPRANQYPENYSRAMVAYAEDPYWTQRTVPLPRNILVPPRPYDYYDIPDRTPPPEDFNWIPPVGDPPISIPREAYELFEERRREHRRILQEERDDPSPNL